MHAQLSRYRLIAAKDGFFWNRTNPVEISRSEPRPATASETARILGDWECKEIEFMQRSHPEYAPSYIAQAGRTLWGAYEKGERDPAIVAALGLYECAVGHDLPARYFLEAAVRAGVVRPRAYVELARIRLAEALAEPAGKDGRLDAEQTAAVLDLLGAVRSQTPPQLRAYLLAAETWEHSVLPPAAADVAFLEEGGRYFPDDSALAAAVGRLKAVKN